MRAFINAMLLFFVCGSLLAQQENSNIITDRPRKTESPITMPKGYFQIETGFLLQEFRTAVFDPNNPFTPATGKFQAFTYNTSLFRYGISDKIELRLIQEVNRSRIRIDNSTVAQSETELLPTYIGTKIHVLNQDGWKPQIGFLAHIGGPLFSDLELGTEVNFRFNFQHQLSDNLTLAYNLGGIIDTDANENAFTVLYTLVFGYSITPKLNTFAEIYGFLPGGGINDHQVDFGVVYLVSPNFQLDVFYGTGLNDFSPDNIVGFGFSVRIPKN